jgi:microcystin-dependent protein
MDSDIGFIYLFGGNFAPRNFALCEGQLINIATNTALFSILGTTYGGNGVNTFGLPDLRGRVAMGADQGPGLTPRVLGEISGTETTQLTQNNLPPHNHNLNVSASAGTTGAPTATTYLAKGPATGSGPNAVLLKTYTTNSPDTTLGPLSVSGGGGNQPFSIVQPYLVLNYIITIFGIFPSRN